MGQIQLIKVTDKIIKVGGKVFYNDRRRRIDLKRPICDLFPEGTIQYIMELCLSKEGAIKRMGELVNEDVVPVLLYFTKREIDDLRMRQQ